MENDAVQADWHPRRNEDVEERDLPDGLVLFDPQSHVVHHLNPVATLVWELADGRPVRQVTADVVQILTTEHAPARARDALNQLRSAGLVV